MQTEVCLCCVLCALCGKKKLFFGRFFLTFFDIMLKYQYVCQQANDSGEPHVLVPAGPVKLTQYQIYNIKYKILTEFLMPTEAQIIANRRNAQKSTGPRTPEGRSIVSQNAVKHELTAAHDIISSESQADFDLYRDQFLTELAPTSPMESMLAERVVNLSWRLKRVGRIQNQAIDALNAPDTSSPLTKLAQSLLSKVRDQSPNAPSESAPELALGRLAVKDFSNTRVLERLLMYERRIENSLYKTLLELQRLNLIKTLNPECEMPFNQ